jgi:hypothetical protein
MTQRAHHDGIVANSRNKLLRDFDGYKCKADWHLSNAYKFHKKHKGTPSPFVAGPQSLTEEIDQQNKPSERPSADFFIFRRAQRTFLAKVESDLTVQVSFIDDGDAHSKIVPWPLQIPRNYKLRGQHLRLEMARRRRTKLMVSYYAKKSDSAPSKIAVLCTSSKYNGKPSKFALALRASLKTTLRNDIIRTVNMFEGAAHLIDDADDPAWTNRPDLVVPHFATFNLAPYPQVAIIKLAQDLVDYIAITDPGAAGKLTCIIESRVIHKNGRMSNSRIVIDQHGHLANAEELEHAAKKYLASEDCPLHPNLQFHQINGTPTVLAGAISSPDTSAHRKIEVITRINDLLSKYPLSIEKADLPSSA